MKEQTNELKPCPFCGSTHVIVDTTVLGAYIPECLDCCAVISFCYPTKAEAIAAWNRRAEAEANARLIAAAPEMYELLKVWTQIRAEPTLKNARERAVELLDSIDGKEAEHEQIHTR